MHCSGMDDKNNCSWSFATDILLYYGSPGATIVMAIICHPGRIYVMVTHKNANVRMAVENGWNKSKFPIISSYTLGANDNKGYRVLLHFRKAKTFSDGTKPDFYG